MSNAYQDSLDGFANLILGSDQRVSAYTNNYLLGHAAALANTFLLSQKVLSEDVFSALGKVYTEHYPPTNWDLNLYGSQFPAFLGAQVHGPKADAFNWHLVADIAAVEYAITQQYYATTDSNEATILNMDAAEFLDEQLFQALNQQHPYVAVTVDAINAETLIIYRHDLQIVIDRSPY